MNNNHGSNTEVINIYLHTAAEIYSHLEVIFLNLKLQSIFIQTKQQKAFKAIIELNVDFLRNFCQKISKRVFALNL